MVDLFNSFARGSVRSNFCVLFDFAVVWPLGPQYLAPGAGERPGEVRAHDGRGASGATRGPWRPRPGRAARVPSELEIDNAGCAVLADEEVGFLGQVVVTHAGAVHLTQQARS